MKKPLNLEKLPKLYEKAKVWIDLSTLCVNLDFLDLSNSLFDKRDAALIELYKAFKECTDE